MDIIGIDPNDKMSTYAQINARKARLTGSKPRFTPTGAIAPPNTVRIVHGVSEALPLQDASCDAVVCTLTLCSVVDPEASLAEVKRVLKPGGKFLFWEHVLSETDEDLKRQQIALTPAQVKRADGCHLDRRTGETIKKAGFDDLDLEYFELDNFGFLNPTVAGIATA
jgi:ubiquinone/menaquinone biosynthesis C-methylase UbiE